MIFPFPIFVRIPADDFEPYIEPEDALEGYELALFQDIEGSKEIQSPSYQRIRFRQGVNHFPKARENWGTINSWKLFRPDGTEFTGVIGGKCICKGDTVCITHFDKS